MPRMNDHTKLVFAVEHILHLQDLIEDNEAEPYLASHLSSIKVVIERQLEVQESKSKS